MIKNLKFAILFIFLSLLTSCSVGMFSNSNFTYFDHLKKVEYEKSSLTEVHKKISNEESDSIKIFVEGETLDFEFEKIGLIETLGAQHSFEEDLLIEIKKLAVERNCDAIINFKKNYTDRESGVMFSDAPRTKYTSKTFSGIAVKITKKI
ncbi:hypothetical protein [Flavobacterium sp.]|uniref:hypothetical protein n=1 Tax=Flavobacterium sp. TaxID=239 RepID=UPI00286E4223|nr:hypothetical protein [Flavobacterium sp.]